MNETESAKRLLRVGNYLRSSDKISLEVDF